MVFTSLEIAKVRFYLGYPQVYLQENPRLEGALSIIQNTNSDAVTMMQGILASLDALETEFGDQSQAGVLQVDEIKFQRSAHASPRDLALRAEGKRLVSQLSLFLGVPVANDAFSERGYQGDNWMQLPQARRLTIS